jgi:hypothetical protein
MWIWIGGLIVFGGGLIAIWPARAPCAGVSPWAHARAPRAASRARDDLDVLIV